MHNLGSNIINQYKVVIYVSAGAGKEQNVEEKKGMLRASGLSLQVTS